MPLTICAFLQDVFPEFDMTAFAARLGLGPSLRWHSTGKGKAFMDYDGKHEIT